MVINGHPWANKMDVSTDSATTIAPPKTVDFFFFFFPLTNVSWMLDTREGANKKQSPNILLFAKGYRTMTSGWKGASCCRRCDRGAGFITGDFDDEKLGGLP